MFVCWGRLSSYGRLVLRGGGNVSLRELKCPGLRSQPAPERRSQPAVSYSITAITTITATIAVTGGLPVIVPAEIFTDVNSYKVQHQSLCRTAWLSPDTQLVSVLLSCFKSQRSLPWC